MKLTMAHVEFWMEIKTQSSWIQKVYAEQAKKKFHRPDRDHYGIEQIVNINGGEKRSRSLATDNLLSFCRSARKRGESIKELLLRLAANPGTIIEPEKRVAFARKWAARIR